MEQATYYSSSRGGIKKIPPKIPMVLLVDDDEDQLNFFSAFFRSRGLDVINTSSATEALSILEDVFVDLVVCDCLMPGMDGREFVEKVRETRSLKKLPVVEFSASPESLAMGVLDSGADAFCVKHDHEALIATLNSVISANDEPVGLLKKIQARFSA